MNAPQFLHAAKIPFAERYDNYIGGQFTPPKSGRYFDNFSPVTGQPIGQIARSDAADIEAALDAAHGAKDAWGKTAPAARAQILNRIADRMEENLDLLARAETWDNGKPIRETTAADLPLAIDHFRYFAGVLRAQEGSLSEIDDDTVTYHFHEPLGVVGQIIPWNFPLLMACWKLAPALAAGNCVVLKPAEQTPATIMLWANLIGDLLPAGVLNIVNGFGLEAGAAARQLLAEIIADHGPVLFHQSGGCCDGASPMCYPRNDYIVGEQDVLMGWIGDTPFYISASQYDVWKHTHLTIDVVPGRGGIFSLDNGREKRFLTRSRICIVR